MADGVPTGLDARRIAALGNAVVPAVGRYIGRLVIHHDHARRKEVTRAPTA